MLRARNDAPSLRRRDVHAAVRAAIEAGADRFGFRVVHYSVQGNHLHLIVEALDRESLTRGMQGLMIRIARAVNRTAAPRKGRVFSDHYFARELRTPAEARRAVRYVLDNHLHHAQLEPHTWLLTTGWLRSRAGPLPVVFWPKFTDDG